MLAWFKSKRELVEKNKELNETIKELNEKVYMLTLRYVKVSDLVDDLTKKIDNLHALEKIYKIKIVD